jgi:hypothetical protein
MFFVNQKSKEQQIIDLEAYWSGQMCVLVSDDRIDDSDALYQEFVVDGEEPSEWIFLEYVNDI